MVFVRAFVDVAERTYVYVVKEEALSSCVARCEILPLLSHSRWKKKVECAPAPLLGADWPIMSWNVGYLITPHCTPVIQGLTPASCASALKHLRRSPSTYANGSISQRPVVSSFNSAPKIPRHAFSASGGEHFVNSLRARSVPIGRALGALRPPFGATSQLSCTCGYCLEPANTCQVAVTTFPR